MSGRSYLSIGDVLTLLRQEFPDVTISKIRFLESQGLVNPERTPSGYRKFYDQDVERLRWVLRQQREHFLPLKVIKGRLEAGGDDLDDDFDDLPPLDDLDADRVEDEVAVVVTVAGGEIDGDELIHSGERRRHPEPVLVGQGASLAARATVVGAPALATPAAGGGPGAALPGFESESSDPGHVGEVELAAATFVASSEIEAEKAEPAVAAASSRRSGPSRPAAGRSASKSAPAASAPKVSATPAGPAPTVPSAPDIPSATMAGSDMTIEELASASGSTVGDIQQLESFGLVAGRPVGGVAYYDDGALAIARTAAGFARFGVEARHLRFHKHAAEREAGFIEQIVLPLLKQRNPEARQRAQDNVAELSRLGQSLRMQLLRHALRDQLGG